MRRHIRCGEIIDAVTRKDMRESMEAIDGDMYVVFEELEDNSKRKDATE